MNKLTKSLWIVLTAFGMLTAISGCGGPRGLVIDGEPTLVQPSVYETLWVEPQIIFADSLITLIRADRIDSALVKPSERGIERPSSVEIRIPQASCNVAVDLLDANLRIIRPLLIQDLKAGYYRLALNSDRFREPSLPPGRYFLRAGYCGRSEMTMFTRP